MGYVHRMAKKQQIKQLRHRDLGKHVVYTEANGDRSSGELKWFAFYANDPTTAHLAIGNAQLQAKIDESIEVDRGDDEDDD